MPNSKATAHEIFQSFNYTLNLVQAVIWKPRASTWRVHRVLGDNKLPMLTAMGDVSTLEEMLNCFAEWDGEVEIRALQCGQGLFDFWVVD